MHTFMFMLSDMSCEPKQGYTTRSCRNKNRLHAGDDSYSSATNTARVTAVAPRPKRHPGVQACRHPSSEAAVGVWGLGVGGLGDGRKSERAKRGTTRGPHLSPSNSRPGRPSGLGDGDNGNGNDSARGRNDEQQQRASKRGP